MLIQEGMEMLELSVFEEEGAGPLAERLQITSGENRTRGRSLSSGIRTPP